jgi:hypothetical protein
MIKYAEDNKKEMETLKAELKTNFEAKVLELSNQPSRKPIKSSPEQSAPLNSRERLQNAINNVKN